MFAFVVKNAPLFTEPKIAILSLSDPQEVKITSCEVVDKFLKILSLAWRISRAQRNPPEYKADGLKKLSSIKLCALCKASLDGFVVAALSK